MIAYLYDEETFEYKGETTEAALDPEETRMSGKQVYSLPGNASFDMPLPAKEGYAVVFDKEVNTWQYTEDYRGKRAYSDEGLLTIKYIGPLQGSDKLLSEEQIEGLDNGTLIWKDGEIIEKPAPTVEEQVRLLEQQIENINSDMLRDIRVLLNPTATDEEKQEAQKYFNKKTALIEELIEKINELKNTAEE